MDSLINLIEEAIGEATEGDRSTSLPLNLRQPIPSKEFPPLRRLSVIAEMTECSSSYRSSLNPCTPNRSAVKLLKESDQVEKRTSLPNAYVRAKRRNEIGESRKSFTESLRIDGSESKSRRRQSFEESQTRKNSGTVDEHSFSTSVSSVSGKITWDGETEENINVRDKENATDRPVAEFRPIAGLEKATGVLRPRNENYDEGDENFDAEVENPDPIVYDSIELEPYDDIEQFKLNVERFFRMDSHDEICDPGEDAERQAITQGNGGELGKYERDIRSMDDCLNGGNGETNRRCSNDSNNTHEETRIASKKNKSIRSGKNAIATSHVEVHSTEEVLAHYRDEQPSPSRNAEESSSSTVPSVVNQTEMNHVAEFENMYGNFANSIGSFGADREDDRDDRDLEGNGAGMADVDCNEDILPEANMSFLFTSRDNEGRVSPSLSEVSLHNDDSILGYMSGPCTSSSDDFDNPQNESKQKLPPSGRWSNAISGDHPSPGVFFSQKSGAMGDLAGVGSARKRPKFYSPALDGTVPKSSNCKLRTARKPCRLFSPAKNNRQNDLSQPESLEQTRIEDGQTGRKGLPPIPQSPEPEIQDNDGVPESANGDFNVVCSIEKHDSKSLSRTKNEIPSRELTVHTSQDRSTKAYIPSEPSFPSNPDPPIQTTPRRLLCADTPTQFAIRNITERAISYRILWLDSVYKVSPDQGCIPVLGSEIITVERTRRHLQPFGQEEVQGRAKSDDEISDRFDLTAGSESQIMVIVDGKVASTVDVVLLDCTDEGTSPAVSLRPARSGPPRSTSSASSVRLGRDVNDFLPVSDSSSAPRATRSKRSGIQSSEAPKQPPPSHQERPRNHQGLPIPSSSRKKDGSSKSKPTVPRTKPVTSLSSPLKTPIASHSPSSSLSDSSSSVSSNCTPKTTRTRRETWVHFGPTQIGKTRRCLISVCNPTLELLQLRATCTVTGRNNKNRVSNPRTSCSRSSPHRRLSTRIVYPHDTHPPFAVPFTKLLVKETSYILLPVIFHPPETGRMSCDLVLEPMGNSSRKKRILVRMTGEGVSEG